MASVMLRRKLRGSRVGQLVLIGAIWFAGQSLANVLGLAIPGGVIGMFALLAALLSGYLRPQSISRGARWFLAELLLFFVPAVLAILDHPEFLGLLGLKILAVIFGGIVVVMGSTALAVEFGLNVMHHIESKHARS
ncbi:CidA/LrgA family protein [Martelella sp. HB161492]|uniref:CidA/LrgA family protein n=1 Tax=Martelella sp. HB161492 TaxID=2720726 RepID=UPI001591742D|nr:CidA/LrgA family protein [Martelella sp. HB161492]